jgi:hypothetical protein
MDRIIGEATVIKFYPNNTKRENVFFLQMLRKTHIHTLNELREAVSKAFLFWLSSSFGPFQRPFVPLSSVFLNRAFLYTSLYPGLVVSFIASGCVELLLSPCLHEVPVSHTSVCVHL